MRADPHAEARESQASLALVLSGALGVQGLLISFVPGSEVPWYAFTALIACGGLRSRRWPRRALAAGLCLGFAALALVAWRHHELRKSADVHGCRSVAGSAGVLAGIGPVADEDGSDPGGDVRGSPHCQRRLGTVAVRNSW